MKNIKNGIGASSGIAIAKSFIIDKPNFEIDNAKISDSNKEIKELINAIDKTRYQIQGIRAITLKKLGKEKALIFDAHIQILDDPVMVEDIKNSIEKENNNAAFSVKMAYLSAKKIFEEMDDSYFKERAADIGDVMTRILANLLNIELPDILAINKEVIIVAEDLTPSETALLDKKFVKGFLVNVGGRTSHAAIMARTMEIPAILGLEDITTSLLNGDLVAMNGDSGLVEINPVDIESWNQLLKKSLEVRKNLIKNASKKAKTLDGHEILLEANIGKPSDVDNLHEYGSEGVGLYRSEFLYMENSTWPSEEEQYVSYKKVLENQKEKITIVRTLDIGGDKNLSYYNFPHEMNPFLGYRAIRFCLDNKDIFKTQLRALGRASIHGNLGVMFPMIATIEEFKEAKEFTLKTFKELKKEGYKVSDKIQIGMMIEIPSSAIIANQFAKYSDFFSIGTNDLIQYSFAVDRMSQKVKYLYQPNNPALLNLIKLIIEGAKNNQCWVGMCGEMAGEILSIPILLGLADKGLDALSMSASSIPKAKYLISQLNIKDCYELAKKAILLDTESEVNKLVKDFLKSKKIDISIL